MPDFAISCAKRVSLKGTQSNSRSSGPLETKGVVRGPGQLLFAAGLRRSETDTTTSHQPPTTAREARPGLPEIQHIRPHVPLGLQARAAHHLIIRADLAHRGRDGVLVIRLVLGGNRRLRCPS